MSKEATVTVDDDTALLDIDGVHDVRRYLKACSITPGVRLSSHDGTWRVSCSPSSVHRLIASLVPHFDVRLDFQCWTELACTTACVTANDTSNECSCRCRGAFHAVKVVPPGVGVDDDSPAERIRVHFNGVIHRNSWMTPAKVREGINALLHEHALNQVLSGQYRRSIQTTTPRRAAMTTPARRGIINSRVLAATRSSTAGPFEALASSACVFNDC